MSRNFFPVVMAIGVGVFTGNYPLFSLPPSFAFTATDSDVKFLRRLLHLPANFPADGDRKGSNSSAATVYRYFSKGD